MGKGAGKLHRVPLSPSAAFEADNLAMGPTLSHKRDPTHHLKVLRILSRTQAAAERNCSTIKSQVRQSLQEIPCSEPSAEMSGTEAEQKGDRAILPPLMSNTAKEDPHIDPYPKSLTSLEALDRGGRLSCHPHPWATLSQLGRSSPGWRGRRGRTALTTSQPGAMWHLSWHPRGP